MGSRTLAGGHGSGSRGSSGSPRSGAGSAPFEFALWLLVALSSLGLAGPAVASARSPADAIAVLEHLPEFRQAAISPDGTRAAWVEVVPGERGAGSGGTRIRVAVLATGRTVVVGAAAASRAAQEGEVAWSPDGTRLAFVSDAEKAGQPQLYVWDVGSGRSRRLTRLRGDVASPAFSPDGRRIAFRHTAGASAAPAMTASVRETGVVGTAWPVARIAVIDSTGGPVRAVSPPDLFVYEFDWSPDGTSLAATAARGPGMASWYVAQLVTVALASGETRTLAAPSTQIAHPRWRPDGGAVALIGGLMSDEGLAGGDVWLVPADGNAASNLTDGRRASPSSFSWTGPDRLLVSEWEGGGSAVVALRPSDRHVEPLWRGDEHVGASPWQVGLSLARDGRTSAVVRSTFDRPSHLEAGPIGAWKSLQAPAAPTGLVGSATSLTWRTDVGDVQGWLLAPPAVENGRRYPLVVAVHGGPSAAFTPNTWMLPVFLASQGYYVLLPNPRGSFGRGEAFTRANVRDLGGGDLRDILAGVDAALAAAPIDPERVGVYGWSYGGFISMWAVTQTKRFRAAVAGAGIANWLSYYGTNHIETWMRPFFGATPYDDPEAYRRCSAIEHVKKARTPTLLLHGERDAEVSVTQSRELWKALRTLGVPTELVVFPDEGHAPSSPIHRRESMTRTLEWFDRWLGAPARSLP